MPRFAANLSLLFTEMPMAQRFKAAAAAGFEGVEILYPYDIPAAELSAYAAQTGLEFVLINAPPPNWAGGPRGFAALPGQQELFRRDFDRALRFAQALRTRHIHVMAGPTADPAARDTMVENLTWAVERAPHFSLTIEPVNQTDMPGYYLADFDLAAGIIAEVGAPNLGLQFDAYHAQVLTGDVVGTWQRHADIVRHVQIASYPGRKEPMGGEIDYPAFFRMLEDSGYRGWISAEYHPARLTESGLGWMQHHI